jgi:hypothetical protein
VCGPSTLSASQALAHPWLREPWDEIEEAEGRGDSRRRDLESRLWCEVGGGDDVRYVYDDGKDDDDDDGDDDARKGDL